MQITTREVNTILKSIVYILFAYSFVTKKSSSMRSELYLEYNNSAPVYGIRGEIRGEITSEIRESLCLFAVNVIEPKV